MWLYLKQLNVDRAEKVLFYSVVLSCLWMSNLFALAPNLSRGADSLLERYFSTQGQAYLLENKYDDLSAYMYKHLTRLSLEGEKEKKAVIKWLEWLEDMAIDSKQRQEAAQTREFLLQKKEKLNFILIGRASSGKGTIGKAFSKQFGNHPISTGDLLRDEVKRKTPLGIRIEDTINAGNMVDDDTMIELVENEVNEHPDLYKNGIIFDGFPRTIGQAMALAKWFEGRGEELDGILYLNVPRELALVRIQSRVICEDCKKEYNLLEETLKPKKEGECDDCGGKLIARQDDQSIDALNNRWDTFDNKTLPELVTAYSDEWVEILIENEVPPKKVFLDALSGMGQKKNAVLLKQIQESEALKQFFEETVKKTFPREDLVSFRRELKALASFLKPSQEPLLRLDPQFFPLFNYFSNKMTEMEVEDSLKPLLWRYFFSSMEGSKLSVGDLSYLSGKRSA